MFFLKKKFGFCTIPPALIRRYSYELKQPIEAIAKSLELERLNQLEQIGKLGVKIISIT